jgi:hypothetical protein
LFAEATELYNKSAEINSRLIGLRDKPKTGKKADPKDIADKSVLGLDEKLFNDLNKELKANEEKRIAAQERLINELVPSRSNAANVNEISQLTGAQIDPKAAQQFSKASIVDLTSKATDLSLAKDAQSKLKTGDAGGPEAEAKVKAAQKAFDDTLDKAMSSVTDPTKFAYIGAQLGVGIDEAVYNMLNAAQKASIDAAFKTAREGKELINKAGATDAEKKAGQKAINEAGVKVGEMVTKAVSDPARDAGLAYASSVKSSFESGVKGILEGKNDGKGILMTAFDSFATGVANSVFDGVAKSLTESLFSPDKMMSGLKNFGSGIFSAFGGGAGTASVGADVASSVAAGGTESSTGILSSLLTAVTSFFAPVLAFFGFSQASKVAEDATKVIEQSQAAIDSANLAVIAVNTGIIAAMSAVPGFATGGYVSGPGSGTSDSIPSLLSNGEFVVNAASTRRFAPLLHSINNGSIGRFAAGGMVGTPTLATIQPTGSSSNGSSQSTFNINVTGNVSQQTRNEIQRMIPQIARGTDKHRQEVRQRR